MFTVYSEKEIFEKIILGEQDSPNWNCIFRKYADICLNMTDNELKAEEVEGTLVFEYIKMTGGKTPVALKEYFDEIYENPKEMAQKPRAAFFLNYSLKEATQKQNAFGVIVQSKDGINDNVLAGSFTQKLLKGQEIIEGNKLGWEALLKFIFPPSNSIILSDNYLLTSTERNGSEYIAAGKENILWILDAILPESLSIPYHVTVISEDNNHNETWRNNLSGDLITGIKELRMYEINVEVVFVKSEKFHERILLMNYINASCEHGFYVFKVRDGKTVHMVNKIRINSYFSNLTNSQGQSEYELANEDLRTIKEVCMELTLHLQSGNSFYKGDILGNCNTNKSLKNPLLKDV